MELNLEKINIRKEKIDLIKTSKGFNGFKCKVKLLLDKSGSMYTLFKNGSIQNLLERIVPIGLSIDDDSKIDLVLFDSDVHDELYTISLENLKDFVSKTLSNISFGGTCYAPAIESVFEEYNENFFDKLFKFFGSKKSIKKQIPTFSIFITDGENYDKKATELALIKSSKLPIFYSFIGIGDNGCKNFPFLEKLDSLPNRSIDNTNFVNVSSINTISDDVLYNAIFKDFEIWLNYINLSSNIG